MPSTPPTHERPRLLVAVDGSAGSTRQLIWALQEAARREATVLAVAVLASDAFEDERTATQVLVEAQVQHAIGETGVHGRSRTALLDPPGFEALARHARGGDLVVVRPPRTTSVRPSVPPRLRRPLGRG